MKVQSRKKKKSLNSLGALLGQQTKYWNCHCQLISWNGPPLRNTHTECTLGFFGTGALRSTSSSCWRYCTSIWTLLNLSVITLSIWALGIHYCHCWSSSFNSSQSMCVCACLTPINKELTVREQSGRQFRTEWCSTDQGECNSVGHTSAHLLSLTKHWFGDTA